MNLDVLSFRFWLDPPHYESNVDKLISSIIYGSNFAKDVSLTKYKQHLDQHLAKCKGPCKLNIFGVPICTLKKCEKEKIDKMFYSLYVFLQSESTVYLAQMLFDMIYKPEQYSNVLDFISINAARNPKLYKLVGM